MKTEETLSLNFFTTSRGTGKSTTVINGQFVFSQLLVDCLVRLKSNETDKQELITHCETEYKSKSAELTNLREFQQEYSPQKALWWYTRESFFYRTLNAALREQNIHLIFLYRSFISDIHRQLQNYQSKESLRVYRSQVMSNEELDYLKQNIGEFVSVNSFLSTTKLRQMAEFYMGDTTQKINLERVLFEIDADPEMVTTKPFAEISKYSHFVNEFEVLFMLGSIFRLNHISLGDNQIWTIRMSLCRDDEHNLKEVFLDMKNQNGTGETSLSTLGKVLWAMGKLDLAEKYYTRLVNELSSNDGSLRSLYMDLSMMASQQSKYDESIYWRQKAREIKAHYTPTDSIKTGKIIRAIITGGPEKMSQILFFIFLQIVSILCPKFCTKRCAVKFSTRIYRDI
jgi:hypothetical protein